MSYLIQTNEREPKKKDPLKKEIITKKGKTKRWNFVSFVNSHYGPLKWKSMRQQILAAARRGTRFRVKYDVMCFSCRVRVVTCAWNDDAGCY